MFNSTNWNKKHFSNWSHNCLYKSKSPVYKPNCLKRLFLVNLRA